MRSALALCLLAAAAALPTTYRRHAKAHERALERMIWGVGDRCPNFTEGARRRFSTPQEKVKEVGRKISNFLPDLTAGVGDRHNLQEDFYTSDGMPPEQYVARLLLRHMLQVGCLRRSQSPAPRPLHHVPPSRAE